MFRLKEGDTEPPTPPLTGSIDEVGYGILIVDASDGSSQLPLFLDLLNDPCKYRGRMVYITALGPTPRPDPFLFPQKFYFNENCQWYESPFTINGLF